MVHLIDSPPDSTPHINRAKVNKKSERHKDTRNLKLIKRLLYGGFVLSFQKQEGGWYSSIIEVLLPAFLLGSDQCVCKTNKVEREE